MKTKNFLSILALGLIVSSFGQKPTMELTFTAENNGQYIPLDSIFIENLTQGGDTILFAPDTVFVLDYFTNINDYVGSGESTFSISQNYPNPFKGKTTINLYLPKTEKITITIMDISGKEVAQYKNTLNQGIHSFTYYSGKEIMYLFTVKTRSEIKTIKMAGIKHRSKEYSNLVYNGCDDMSMMLKQGKAFNDFIFEPGDQLRYIGYSKTITGVNGSGVIEDIPLDNITYGFDVSEGFPCPDIPTVTYENQVYNTLIIGNQCWLKENLNVGTMINVTEDMTDNGTIEKYCFNNNLSKCEIYGGLYQWDEVMQYTTIQGAKGICPTNWHLPTDEELKQLEGAVDNQFVYPDPEWDGTGWRGYDAGIRLRDISGWLSNTGTNEFGFTALPGGIRVYNGFFSNELVYSYFWSSSEYNTDKGWQRFLDYENGVVNRSFGNKNNGLGVRCVLD